MEPIVNNQTITSIPSVRVKSNLVEKLNSFFDTMEYYRYGITPVFIVVVACIGGFAGAFAIQDNPIKLAVVVLSTGITEAFLLAVMPLRLITFVSIASILISLVTIFI